MCLILITLTTQMLSLMQWVQYILCLSQKRIKYKDLLNFYIKFLQKNLSHKSMILQSLYVYILKQRKSQTNIKKRDIFTQCFRAIKICRKDRIFLMFLNCYINAIKFIKQYQSTLAQNTIINKQSTISYKIFISKL